ncbi:MAG: SDR family NAD(P)-dependent oxidoreductase [Spirochaetes bacterium]|nr:SDR family NAD(P)-dependent oxidoreductase [Spirochaetota bacterium]
MSKYDLKGKYVLITGAATGIGKELSRCFAAAGANCVLHALPGQRKTLAALGRELREKHAVKVWCLFEDFLDRGGPEKLYRKVSRNVPRLDVLVNNAGMVVYGPFHRARLGPQENLVRVNAIAYMDLMRLSTPGMIKRGGGRVLNVSSVSAFQPTPHHAVYGATKAFIQSLSEAVNQELRGTGVRITALCPSYTDTPLLKKGGFPEKVRWIRISGLADPAVIARKGVRALVKGRPVYVPGLVNKFVHLVLNRITPRVIVDAISNFALKKDA